MDSNSDHKLRPGELETVSNCMDCDELAGWLQRKGIPESFCSILKGIYSYRLRVVAEYFLFLTDNYKDGRELLHLKEQDIKDIIPAIGTVKKILRLVPPVSKLASYI